MVASILDETREKVHRIVSDYKASKGKEVLTEADIFALPSRYENFANSVAEAIAFGVPVIITDFCGIRSLVRGRARTGSG